MTPTALNPTAENPIKTVADFASAPAEFQDAVRKIVRSHSVNELHGARVFDEPAIAFAPTPYAKWLTCRVAMEEYGHHVPAGREPAHHVSRPPVRPSGHGRHRPRVGSRRRHSRGAAASAPAAHVE